MATHDCQQQAQLKQQGCTQHVHTKSARTCILQTPAATQQNDTLSKASYLHENLKYAFIGPNLASRAPFPCRQFFSTYKQRG